MKPLTHYDKVIIAGSRGITDYNLVELAVIKSGWTIGKVVSGKAQGVDTLGEKWAQEHGVPVAERPARWWVNGEFIKAAGIQRNHQMGEEADAAICIWDGISPGTRDMINYMKKLGKPCFVYRIDQINLFDIVEKV